MANVFRYIRGPIKEVALPAYASDAVEVGDLLYWDATNGAVRPASTIGGADYATKKANLAAAFVGVALTGKAAGATGQIVVATDGDFLMVAPSGSGTNYTVGDGVAGGDGTSMLNQTVVKDTTAANQIARVIAPKTTAQAYVTVRLLSKLNR